MSRAKLAAVTGLNKTTVSSLVKELLDANFVREIGAGKSAEAGRKGILVELNPEVGCIIGVEIGVDFISVILANFAAEIRWRQREQTAHLADQEAILQRALGMIHNAVAQAEQESSRVLGLGLGIPGLVDVESGTLLFAPNLHWQDVPLRSLLEREFDFPVYVDNAANMAALGESYYGAARNSNDVLYVSVGVGVGGGYVLTRQIILGAQGLAGEFGHMTIAPDGPQCNCGNRGCWETFVSERALFRRVCAAIRAGQPSSLMEQTDGDMKKLTVPMIVQAAQTHDAIACEALAETGRYLGIGIANLINALNPEMVVLGGTLSLAGKFLLPEIQRVVEERALLWPRRSAQIVVAAQGLDACVMGGIASAYHHILSQPKTISLGAPVDEAIPALVLPDMKLLTAARENDGISREIPALAAH